VAAASVCASVNTIPATVLKVEISNFSMLFRMLMR